MFGTCMINTFSILVFVRLPGLKKKRFKNQKKTVIFISRIKLRSLKLSIISFIEKTDARPIIRLDLMEV